MIKPTPRPNSKITFVDVNVRSSGFWPDQKWHSNLRECGAQVVDIRRLEFPSRTSGGSFAGEDDLFTVEADADCSIADGIIRNQQRGER